MMAGSSKKKKKKTQKEEKGMEVKKGFNRKDVIRQKTTSTKTISLKMECDFLN